MNCPACSRRMGVRDSRITADGVRRVRECRPCQQRYTTHERIKGPAVRGGDRRSARAIGKGITT